MVEIEKCGGETKFYQLRRKPCRKIVPKKDLGFGKWKSKVGAPPTFG